MPHPKTANILAVGVNLACLFLFQDIQSP